jgi:hypothetical protein
LALDVAADALGPPVDDLVRLPAPFVRVADGVLEADVVRVDWYGNLQLAASENDLEEAAFDRVVVSCAAGDFRAVHGRTFGDAEPGGLVVYVDSGGHVAIARNGGSARELLQDPVRVTLKANS